MPIYTTDEPATDTHNQPHSTRRFRRPAHLHTPDTARLRLIRMRLLLAMSYFERGFFNPSRTDDLLDVLQAALDDVSELIGEETDAPEPETPTGLEPHDRTAGAMTHVGEVAQRLVAGLRKGGRR